MVRWLGILLLGTLGALSQAAPPPLAFDVASVKPVAVDVEGVPLSRMASVALRNNRVDLSLTLREIIVLAYNVQGYQVNYPHEFSGVMNSFYDIEGESARPVTEEQLRIMLRALLADRFKLAVQTETRSMPGYALVIAHGGAKPLIPMPPFDPDHPSPGAHGMTMAQFAQALYVDHGIAVFSDTAGGMPVDDETGIKGTYDLSGALGRDFASAWLAPATAQGRGDEPEPLTVLLKEKLGMTLVKKSVSREFIIVTRVERPTPN